MSRRTRVICWIVLASAIVAGIVWWQLAKLSRGLQTMPAGGAGEILVDALSAEVLASGVDGSQPSALGTKPLLDQYHENPALAHRRYLLVMTWVHASQIFKTLGPNPRFAGQMLSSAAVEEVPQKERIDGWGKPYCIFADAGRMTFLSSGGNDALNCETLRQTAMQVTDNSTDSRLTKKGDLLVAVYKRGEHVPTTRLE